ncbi:MAG: hypothetical protein HAW59_02070, partial [Betaproteobacteria bacterium]|nr:hypothetical protein [Betaproteobacteria bacterium]
ARKVSAACDSALSSAASAAAIPPCAPSLKINNLPKAEQKPFITLAEKITAAKEADNNADTQKEEAEIDGRVYALYGLTKEEIKIVEGD